MSDTCPPIKQLHVFLKMMSHPNQQQGRAMLETPVEHSASASMLGVPRSSDIAVPAGSSYRWRAAGCVHVVHDPLSIIRFLKGVSVL